ncbi:MFS transporter [Salipaludibacillus agaradhaerens]|uniref:MFS transporter n=1 Tax=Salipaludibacillus agaradhaerens TaxID=76935 RepID=UPI0021512A73|nr:MFS transporter [Salipaludibacillus agaradhaerens]MCR6106911.1 MFS transporter [Salipaludibacillus agaradhaerens]MCR6118943.1 MFS transporter [Salipaludibacillus agaradhaerens]UJW57998.1 MFS transporter [Bacillus sp. A116_S68]
MASIWKLKGMLFFFHAAMTIIVSYLPVYFQSLGLNGSEIGILLAVGPAAAIVAQPFWGFMSDRRKTVKRILLLCLSSAFFVGFVFFRLEEFFLLFPVMFVFFSFMSPAGGLGDSLSQKVSVQRGVSFGSIRMWGSLGFGSASLAGGYILSYIGIANIYYVFASFLLLAILLTCLAPDSEPTKRPAQLIDAFRLLKERELLIFLAVILTISLTHRMNDSFLSLYIIELGGDESVIGLAWFIGVVTEAAVFALSVYWLYKWHPLTLITIAAAIYMMRWLLMAMAPGPEFVLVLQVMHGLAFGTFYLTAFQFVSKLVPEHLQSTGHLLFIAVFFGFSGVTGSLLGGAIINGFDVRTVYYVMVWIASIGLVSALGYRYVFLKKSREMNA